MNSCQLEKVSFRGTVKRNERNRIESNLSLSLLFIIPSRSFVLHKHLVSFGIFFSAIAEKEQIERQKMATAISSRTRENTIKTLLGISIIYLALSTDCKFCDSRSDELDSKLPASQALELYMSARDSRIVSTGS